MNFTRVLEPVKDVELGKSIAQNAGTFWMYWAVFNVGIGLLFLIDSLLEKNGVSFRTLIPFFSGMVCFGAGYTIKTYHSLGASILLLLYAVAGISVAGYLFTDNKIAGAVQFGISYLLLVVTYRTVLGTWFLKTHGTHKNV
ncbi:MAG: hypothetical protein JW863_16195 [Chitinispirillaceae bacterium]|nr:hypothetical protein [Chitinispirillaceae bacterium]